MPLRLVMKHEVSADAKAEEQLKQITSLHPVHLDAGGT